MKPRCDFRALSPGLFRRVSETSNLTDVLADGPASAAEWRRLHSDGACHLRHCQYPTCGDVIFDRIARVYRLCPSLRRPRFPPRPLIYDSDYPSRK